MGGDRSSGEGDTESYDVFVSYDRDDEPIVEAIVDELRGLGVTAWRDRDSGSGGDRFISTIESAMSRSSACAVFVRGVPTGWHDEELQLALDLSVSNSEFRVIPVLLPESIDDSELPGWLRIRTWVDLRADPLSPSQIERLRDAIQGIPAASDDEARNPYVGLRAFTEHEHGLCFGRDDDAQKAFSRLATSPSLFIIGPSGVGKSSFINAELIPMLLERVDGGEPPEIFVIRPGIRPVRELAAAFAASAGELSELSRGLQRKRSTLALALRELRRCSPTVHRPVLVVDQLEQLFADQVDEEERNAFADNLIEAVEDGQLTLVSGLRSDAYRLLDAHPRFADMVSSNLMRLDQLTHEQLRAAVVEPARAVGLGLQAGLAELVLRDLRTASEPLPLLQHGLYTLYDNSNRRTLTVRTYEQIGGVNGALARHADQVFESLSAQDQAVARHVLAYRLLAPLGESRYTGQLVAVSALVSDRAPEPHLSRVLERLTEDRLLAKASLADGTEVVEITHDALSECWPRLRGWLKESETERLALAHLATEARDWDQNDRAASYLVSGRRLDEAETVPHEQLNDVERGFLSASQQADESRRFAAARARAIRGGVGTMGGLSVAMFVFAFPLSGTTRVATVLVSPIYMFLGVAVGFGFWAGRRNRQVQIISATAAGSAVGAIVTFLVMGAVLGAAADGFEPKYLAFGALMGGTVGLTTSISRRPTVWVPVLVSATAALYALNPWRVWNPEQLGRGTLAVGGAIVGLGAAVGFLTSPKEATI